MPARARPTPTARPSTTRRPNLYWRLGESAGPVAHDVTPNGNDGTYSGGVTFGTAGAVTGDDATRRSTFNGTERPGRRPRRQCLDPTVYSEELWFKTTTTTGGKLIGFGSAATGNSGSYDRHVYMLNNGQLSFGT